MPSHNEPELPSKAGNGGSAESSSSSSAQNEPEANQPEHSDSDVQNDGENEDMSDAENEGSDGGEDGDEEVPSSDDDSSDIPMTDSDSDMSDAEVSEEDNNESFEVKPVPLPEEFSELAAGREVDCDDDEVVQAILRAREKNRNHPPAIECEDGVAALSFHPQEDMIAVGTFTGDVVIYKYSDEECELLHTHESHVKAIREIEFSKDGKNIFSASKDKSILMTDVETGKLTNLWDQAHSSPVHSLYVLDQNRFCSGCEEGHVKLWDSRQREPVFSFQVMQDMVTDIISTPQCRHLAVACGGTITSININAKKIQVQSEEYEHDFTCLGLFRMDSKLLAGSSKGSTYMFNWGEFGYHCDEMPGFKQPVSCLLPVTETVAITGWEDGKIRATHLFPNQSLGIVGQHDFAIECLDISNNGTIIASSAAAGGFVKFWNIKYIEETQVIRDNFNKKKKKKKPKLNEHNLPSSQCRNKGEFFADLAGPS
ncbi:WD repeat-containing protein 55 homolog [Thrips palmi]|uniref:WD repeat-containing protein 55 homolog n=1 Tax=Thrips palmi TaxID=161013 RepID=A0A6P8ZMY4_THRPL|nr:WD repeat-containing protein 55 homolog [Thrips palmi]